MNFRNLFKTSLTKNSDFPQRIRISTDNIGQWLSYENLLKEGRVKFDKLGRLRYLHGAPVGDLILTGLHGNGKPVYRESADEWFDPESDKAVDFKWPE